MSVIAPGELLFFGDLNCPFCYVENERLDALGLGKALQWRGVEHAPDLPDVWSEATEAMDSELDDELAKLAERAPEVPIVRPAHRPNSRLGIMTVAAAVRDRPHVAPALRTALFRGLWRDGRDISQSKVVADICREVGAEGLATTREDRRQAKVWTTEWDTGNFDRRIPVIATIEGYRLLGLAQTEKIAAFVVDSKQGGHGRDYCR